MAGRMVLCWCWHRVDASAKTHRPPSKTRHNNTPTSNNHTNKQPHKQPYNQQPNQMQKLTHHMRVEEEDVIPRFLATDGVTPAMLVRRRGGVGARELRGRAHVPLPSV